jgi:glutamate-ammonia-ligase adenylyltransferase
VSNGVPIALAGAPNAAEASRALERLSPWAARHGVEAHFAEWLSRAADPAAAAANFEMLLGAGWEPAADLVEPLLRIVGASQVLATSLVSLDIDEPMLRRMLATEAVTTGEHVTELESASGTAQMPSVSTLLRRHKRRHVLRIGARDLLGLANVEETVRELSELAEGSAEIALRHARSLVAADYGDFSPHDRLRFVVFAMGKLGGRELNFSSDIDLIYLYDGGRQTTSGGERGTIGGNAAATRIAEIVTRTLSEVTDDGFVFRVDLRLRPDGQNGPIVNSFGAAMTYYEALGQTWERAAMLKARPIAGDADLGAAFLSEIHPFVYRRFLDFNTVEEIEEMKKKVDSSLSRERSDRDVKLGFGGIREIEFVVQALQLVHGGRDQRLQKRSTIETLRALAELSLLESGQAAALAEAYRYLRDVEHKLQIVHERQTQRIPEDSDGVRLLARRLSYHLRSRQDGSRVDEIAAFRADLHRHRAVVRHAFSRLFVSPRAEIRRDADEEVVDLLQHLEDRDATVQLAAMGFREPASAVGHLLRLRDGPRFSPASPRRKKALYALAPALLAAIRKASDPDQALLHMAEFISAIGARSSFLALLEQNPETLRLLVGLFGSSDYLSSFFVRHPELLDNLVRADLALVRKDRTALEADLAGLLGVAEDYEAELDALRRFRNEELLRIGVNDIHGLLEPADVEAELSRLAEVCLAGALLVAAGSLKERYGDSPGRFAVIALGKLGRSAITYNSDLDLIFVYDANGSEAQRGPAPHEYFTKLAQRLVVVLQITTREGYVYKIDTRLRPSGSHGPLVSSLDAFREYHRTSSALWERQALISARGVAGDVSLIAATEAVAQGFVFGRGLDEKEVAEIARMRRRMEQELAREEAGHVDLKTGRGGLVDVEFIAEMLVLRHGHERPSVRQRRTEEALDALRDVGALAADDHGALVQGYRFLRRVESRLRIERDQAVHTLNPTDSRLGSLARRLGYAGDGAERRLLADVEATRERVRTIFDRLFSVSSALADATH